MRLKKILFANFPADGHFNPLTGLAVHLKDLGHDVRWYTGKKYQEKIERLDIQYYPLKRAIDFSMGEPDQIFPERKNYKSQVAKIRFDIKHAFVLRGPEYYEDIREIDREFHFDLLIADIAFTGIPFVRQKMDRPVIAIGVFPLPESSRDLPPNGLGLTPSKTFFGLRKQDLMRFFADKFIFGESKKLVDKIYADYNMESAKGNVFDVVCREADLLLQSGTPGFEYFRSDLRKNIRFIGPLLPYRQIKRSHYQLPLQYQKFRKKILVTQGTVETDIEKLLIPALNAFKNSDVLVIATTGGSKTQELRDKYPDANFLIEDFIPFDDIMHVCDVYVTNGGYGGVMLGIQNKLPMVVAGVHEGKNEINARVGYFQLGVNLKTETPSAEQIKIAVDKIFQDDRYKKNVTRLAAEFEKYDPLALTEKYISEILPTPKNAKVTFLRMMEKYQLEKVY